MMRAVSAILFVAALGLATPRAAGAADLVADEVSCQPQCDGLECGDDGCGGQCGLCPAYHQCAAGACAWNGGCRTEDVPGCGGCTCGQCVCQLDPYCCTAKWDSLCVSRCNNQCGGCGTQQICGDSQCNGAETCQTCPSDCGTCPPACGPITGKGCCQVTTLLKCVDGVLTFADCAAEDDQGTCGWDPDSAAYACGGQGADPAGEFPLTCATGPGPDVVTDTSLPEGCDTYGFAGCCDGTVVRWCDAGGVHTLDCAANPAPFHKCGWNVAHGYYDCGGAGSDPSGAAPLVCPEDPDAGGNEVQESHQCKVGTLVDTGCQDVGWEGCCGADGALYFCEQGQWLCRLDCPALLPPNDVCGWHASTPGYYDCGGDGADPAGDYPLACPALVVAPDVVTPDVPVTPPACPDVPESGCCAGSLLHWCEEGIERTFDCAGMAADPVFGAYVYCGTNPASGDADCLKKPDPSPPLCDMNPVEPTPEPVEPGPEPAPDTAESAPDLPPDAPEPQTETVAADHRPDSPGLGIPADSDPPPARKDDGCTAGPHGSPTALALFLLLLVVLGRTKMFTTETLRAQREATKRT